MTPALLDALDAVAGGGDLDDVLTRIVAAAAEITGARSGALGVREGAAGALRFLTVGPDDLTWTAVGDHVRDRDLLVVPVRVREEMFGLIYLAGRTPDPAFTDEDEALVRVLADAAGHVVEHSRADALAERRRRWLEATADLSEALTTFVPPERALEQVVRRARVASGARAAAVVSAPRRARPTIAAYDGPAGLVSESTVQQAAAHLWGSDHTLGDPRVLVVRLRARLAKRCALVLVLPAEVDASDELDLLAQFADQAGLALDRARALADREELAVIAERERIARELHDVVVQKLFGAGLQLQSLRETPELLNEGVDVVVDLLDAVIREIRGTVLELREDPVSPRRAASLR